MKPPPDRQLILGSLAAIARGAGRAPSRSEFLSLSGISEHQVSQFFPTWNDAVRAAGLPPNTLNARLHDRELLEDWGHAVRKHRAMPARRAYHHLGKFDHRTLERRLGPWSKLPEVFRKFAQDKPEWADVLNLLPARPEEPREPRSAGVFSVECGSHAPAFSAPKLASAVLPSTPPWRPCFLFPLLALNLQGRGLFILSGAEGPCPPLARQIRSRLPRFCRSTSGTRP